MYNIISFCTCLVLWYIVMNKLEKYGLTVHKLDFWLVAIMIYVTAFLSHTIAN